MDFKGFPWHPAHYGSVLGSATWRSKIQLDRFWVFSRVKPFGPIHDRYTTVMVSIIFYFHPENWGNDPIWRLHIFQMGWKVRILLNPHILLSIFEVSSLKRALEARDSEVMWCDGWEGCGFFRVGLVGVGGEILRCKPGNLWENYGKISQVAFIFYGLEQQILSIMSSP